MNNPVIIFISQKMRGRKEIDVMLEREIVKTMLIDAGITDFEIIDQYHVEGPKGTGRIWYLGNSIQLMDSADVVIFTNDWKSAPGCLVERLICSSYNIPVLTMADLTNLKDRLDILYIDMNKRRVDYGRKELKH